MSIFRSKMPSFLHTSFREQHHLNMVIYISFLAITLLIRTTQAAAVLNYYNLTSFTPPRRGMNLNRFVVHNRTGNIFLAAEKNLFRLGSDLQSLGSTGTSSCALDESCEDITKILAISQGDADNLIICTSAEGRCEVRNLLYIEDVIDSGNIMVPGETEGLTAAGVITKVNRREQFYLANTLSGDYNSIISPIRRWTVSDSLDQVEDELNHYALTVSVNNFPISYKETFTYEEFAYFVMNQDGNVKLGRVCKTAIMEYYSEITLRCDSRSRTGTPYNVIQAARVGKPGPDLQMSMGSGSDDILFAAFSESDVATSHAALCVYRMADVKDAFMQASKQCKSGNMDARLTYLADANCVSLAISDDILPGLVCSSERTFTYANGIEDLVSTAAVEPSSHVPSSIVSAVVRHHTVVFIGTQGGDLLKVNDTRFRFVLEGISNGFKCKALWPFIIKHVIDYKNSNPAIIASVDSLGSFICYFGLAFCSFIFLYFDECLVEKCQYVCFQCCFPIYSPNTSRGTIPLYLKFQFIYMIFLEIYFFKSKNYSNE